MKKQVKVRHFSSDAETWLDGQASEMFLSGLQKSLVAVACFLPGRVWDLSAPLYIPWDGDECTKYCNRESGSFRLTETGQVPQKDDLEYLDTNNERSETLTLKVVDVISCGTGAVAQLRFGT